MDYRERLPYSGAQVHLPYTTVACTTTVSNNLRCAETTLSSWDACCYCICHCASFYYASIHVIPYTIVTSSFPSSCHPQCMLCTSHTYAAFLHRLPALYRTLHITDMIGPGGWMNYILISEDACHHMECPQKGYGIPHTVLLASEDKFVASTEALPM